MKDLARPLLRRVRLPRSGRAAHVLRGALKASRSGRAARILRGALYIKLGLLVAVTLGVGVLYLRLTAGPLSFGKLPQRVASSIAARIGPGWSVTLRNTALQLEDGSPALRAMGLDIRNPEGAVVLRAPFAIVSVGGLSLLTANFQPRSIEFRDLQLRTSVNRDGSLSFVPGQDTVGAVDDPVSLPAPPPVGSPKMEAGTGDVSPVSVALGSIFDLMVGPGGVIGSLDRARLTNARLTVMGDDQKERATFDRVDATFDRTQSGGRKFEAAFAGGGGTWRLNGDAIPDGQGGYTATMVAADAPVQDLLLLSGLSAIPASTNLKMSGRIDASFAGGRVVQLKAQLSSNAGAIQIADPDTSPLDVETLALDAAWDEARRALVVSALELKGGDTRLKIAGELVVPPGAQAWNAVFRTRDASLNGAAPGDAPVRVTEAEARLSGRDGVTVESLTVRGPALSVDVSGVIAPTADPRGLQLDVRASQSGVRQALRVWPEAVASKVRRFLVANLKAGTVERLGLKVAMTGADMTAAFGDGPLRDEAIRLDFALADATLSAAEGLPPLTQTPVSGTVTGRSVAVKAPRGVVQMADGRTLNASDGSFSLDNYWAAAAVAQIGFRLSGTADGLASLLTSPLIREIAVIDVNPANVRGKTELKVGIPLAVHDIPSVADMPLVVQGSVTELAVDNAFGKERLEMPALSVAYDRGNLAIRGDGKLAGLPASIDARQTREAGGDAVVSFTLDDAARQRKGLGLGSQLTGPLAVKAALPLGKNPRQGIRIEADFQKTAVDGLVPGWTKPAGRPGKLALTLVDGPVYDIRDLQLDAGSTQIRGTATMTHDGTVEKADLPTFKLSAGDDMRAQIERVNGVHKVTVRGNVGDARPFTRGLGSSPGASGSGRANAAKDALDADLDVVLNILTGSNSEAITNASLKASIRKDSIRQLDMKGRLGSSNVIAQTVPRAGGAPVIVAQAEDAGSLLRFLDIYRRMEGGDMVLQLATGDGPQAGFLTLHGFSVRNEPALRRIIPTQTFTVPQQDANGRTQNVRVDVNEIGFTKARVDFTRNAGRLDFKDAAIWGPSIGFTLNGFLDYARDRTDISGTFVPAYGLNNAFAQVPLFGPLLGGGQYEGLFAVNFRLTGQASAPALTVNPLSAVAPGFLRKLFGVGSAADAPTGSVPAPPREVGN